MGARTANAILGTWLFFSAFLWRHSPPQFASAVTAGIAAVTLAVFGLTGRSWPRPLNVVVGGWLIVSAPLLPRTSAATLWNHVLVGLGVLVFALVPKVRQPRTSARVT